MPFASSFEAIFASVYPSGIVTETMFDSDEAAAVEDGGGVAGTFDAAEEDVGRVTDDFEDAEDAAFDTAWDDASEEGAAETA